MLCPLRLHPQPSHFAHVGKKRCRWTEFQKSHGNIHERRPVRCACQCFCDYFALHSCRYRINGSNYSLRSIISEFGCEPALPDFCDFAFTSKLRFIGLKPKHSVVLRNNKADPRVPNTSPFPSLAMCSCLAGPLRVVPGHCVVRCSEGPAGDDTHFFFFFVVAAVLGMTRFCYRCAAGKSSSSPPLSTSSSAFSSCFESYFVLCMARDNSGRNNVRFVKNTGSTLEVSKLLKVRSPLRFRMRATSTCAARRAGVELSHPSFSGTCTCSVAACPT